MFINTRYNCFCCRLKGYQFFVASLLLLLILLLRQFFFKIYIPQAVPTEHQSVTKSDSDRPQASPVPSLAATTGDPNMGFTQYESHRNATPSLDDNPYEDKAVVHQIEEAEDLKTLQAEMRHVGNVPDSLIEQTDSDPASLCSRRPSLYDISFSNKQWQLVGMKPSVNKTNMYVFGAYLDTRVDAPVIRIIMVSDHDLTNLNKPPYCQLWYRDNSKPRVQRIKEMQYMWDRRWNTNNRTEPYLLTCELPDEKNMNPALSDLIGEKGRYKLPEAVSVVEETCDHAINELKVNFDLPPKGTGKKEFAICTKGLDFSTKDISKRLVDWIEMQRMMGVENIFFYDFALHPNVYKVLKYYETKGIVNVTPLTLPGFQPNFPMARHRYLYKFPYTAWKQEMVPYTDCLLKHMYKYNFIAAMDIDEALLPREHQDWKGLVAELRSSIGQQSYCFNSYYFTETIMKDKTVLYQISGNSSKKHSQEYPFMTNRLHKVRVEYTDLGGKCLHDTEKVLIVHNHYPKVCLVDECFTTLNESKAIYHHHRNSYDIALHKQPDFPDDYLQYDPVIIKFKEKLKSRVDDAVREVASQTDLRL